MLMMWPNAHWRISENRDRPIQMTDEHVTDGRRIGELLASEVTARTDGPLSHLELVDIHSDAEGSTRGTFAYAITIESDETTRLADIYIHNDRVRLEFHAGLDPVPATGAEANLRVRPKAAEPPRILVFIENGGEIKRALDVIGAATAAARSES